MRALDAIGNVIDPPRKVTVNVVDVTGPALTIVTPFEGDEFPFVNNIALRWECKGTASDLQTAVSRVEWALDGKTPFQAAIPKAPNDWSTWKRDRFPLAPRSASTLVTIRGERYAE